MMINFVTVTRLPGTALDVLISVNPRADRNDSKAEKYETTLDGLELLITKVPTHLVEFAHC